MANKLLILILTCATLAIAAPTKIVPTDAPVWWIAFSADTTVVHHGVVEPPNSVMTGQPNVETYEDSTTWAVRVLELGGEVPEDVPEEVPEDTE